jgi:TPP-dependent pyruvate/acetoin dehydrogenase alpha subunit
MIEALTYRMGPHSSSDDPSRYREKGEEEAWRKKDPILRFRNYLERRGIWDEEQDHALWEQVRKELVAIVEEVEAAEPMPVSSLFEDVYAEMTPQLIEQRDFLVEEYRKRLEQGEMGHFEGEFPL